MTRRAAAGLLATPLAGFPLEGFAQQGPPVDLQRLVDEAARSGRPTVLPPGLHVAANVRLSGAVHLVGAPGARLFARAGASALVVAPGARARIEGVAIVGAPARPRDPPPLIDAQDAEVEIDGCRLELAPGVGVRLERCAGHVSGTTVRRCEAGAIFALDSRGLAIRDNTVEDAGANGIQVWRSEIGEDGTLVTGNRVNRVRADPGGTGEYGNGVSIFRAGGVIVRGNVVRDTRFSGVRCNAGPNVVIEGNSIREGKDTAIFVEFQSVGAIVSGNLVDGAGSGVQIVNLDVGGRLAVCANNLIRNLAMLPHPETGQPSMGVGIQVEADTTVTGNVVERAPDTGIRLGWGFALRDCLAANNLVRECGIGLSASVAPDAGRATIRGNVVVGARRAALAGMRWTEMASDDLARDAGRYPLLTIADNRASA